MISNFLSKATSATSVSYYIFIDGFILQVDFPFFSAISFTSLDNVEEPRFVNFICCQIVVTGYSYTGLVMVSMLLKVLVAAVGVMTKPFHNFFLNLLISECVLHETVGDHFWVPLLTHFQGVSPYSLVFLPTKSACYRPQVFGRCHFYKARPWNSLVKSRSMFIPE